MTIDERIAAELRRHAPQVDEHMAWNRIQSATNIRRRGRALRPLVVLAELRERSASTKTQQTPPTDQRIRYRGAWGVAAFVAVLAVAFLYVAFSSDLDEVADTAPTPTTFETEVTELLNDFLEARIAGEGAHQYLNVPEEHIPLLYATASGVPYDRAEFEEVRGIEWPYDLMAFKVRLFAGDTVVEQLLSTPQEGGLFEYQPDGFGTDIAPTTEDGQPVAVPYNLFDGEVTLHIAYPWVPFGPGPINLIPEGEGPTTDGPQRSHWLPLLLMADPSPAGTHCLTGSGPTDAEALAESIRSNPDLDATAPVRVSGEGSEALMMDVVGTGAYVHPCNGDRWRDPVLSSGDRVRLYLFEAPEGASMRILAIAIDVPESEFERAVEGPVPVVEFHAP